MGNQKYETLRLYVLILNVLAWIFALISVIGALYIFSTQLMGSGTTGLSILAFGALSFIGLLAYAQLLNVAMDVESNTSKAAYEMNNLSSLVKKIYEENYQVKKTDVIKQVKITTTEVENYSPLTASQQALKELNDEEKAKKD